ncbi:von Willebrand factor A domain-containing protein 1 [Sphaeramia orbicularis]|uniref:von Willebrand factor A domain-containing protein 1 n=1 Tax=Sphaeramia orbicularis TaxID=375764 RepID=A0A673CAG7_9TELE|nr:von Willebrand factor A domain-containing protein 1 [Sphaeramia orbicularis]
MRGFLLGWALLWATVEWSNTQMSVPATVLNCCEGDIFVLLDSSGSVSNYEFSRLVFFVTGLTQPFSLGRGQVRVGLLQVSTRPILEFDLDAHSDQESLQKAVGNIRHLQGDTNTEEALQVAQRLLAENHVNGPQVLLWLTDGVDPGDVDHAMSELKAQGVSVLAVSTVHGNFQVLQRAVTPPLESHLYSVDIDNIDIITNDLRDAIIKIIRAERLRVTHLTSHSAVLQWRPVLTADSGYYHLWYNSVEGTGSGTTRLLRGDSSTVELTNLQPQTTYTASLRPESNQRLLNTLSVHFTTLPDVSGPSVVSVSDSGPRQVRVSWGPLQPIQVQRYTVEYGRIPSGRVHTVTLHNHQNTTLLTGLEPDSQYLITVSALHVNGKERAMSVRACTQEVPAASLPALADLQLSPVEQQEVHVAWRARQEGLRGYWLSWERQSSHSSSIYLPSTTHSTRLTHLTHGSRVCVSPVYSSGRGDGICCTADTQRDSSQWG